jgi:hypothetical protein
MASLSIYQQSSYASSPSARRSPRSSSSTRKGETVTYKERMAAARRAARTEREARRKAERTRAELSAELRRLSLDAVKTMIRARGGKIHLYSVAQLQAQADALIGPWLVAQAKERIARRAEAERNSKDLHKSRRPAVQGLFLCAYPEQNREAK